jgi:hypothetical protein
MPTEDDFGPILTDEEWLEEFKRSWKFEPDTAYDTLLTANGTIWVESAMVERLISVNTDNEADKIIADELQNDLTRE